MAVLVEVLVAITIIYSQTLIRTISILITRTTNTMVTIAIDKGMPVEQVQKLLGHIKIDTTIEYAMVNQNNENMSV